MVTKNDENQGNIIQVEAKRMEYNPISFDDGITYYRIRAPIEKVYKYLPKEEIKPRFDFRA
jgi:hypothetical protein